MEIVSYRGPNQPGGVSTLLDHSQNSNDKKGWWHFQNNRLMRQSGALLENVATINADVFERHYRHCNEFLWPILHERPDIAVWNHSHEQSYRLFNLIIAQHINRIQHLDNLLINDYQLAAVAPYLQQRKGTTQLFWHIPWPQTQLNAHTVRLAETARNLLNYDVVGFHTEEYVQNFIDFVRYLPLTRSVSAGKTIVSLNGRVTRLVVNPAGVDCGFWSSHGGPQKRFTDLPYILSVDRADYTKGLLERINAINLFFVQNPQYIGKLRFVFLTQRSREGLPAYDSYWNDCKEAFAKITARLAQPDWEPIVWYDEPLTQKELARWYTNADGLLVTSLRDGYNLTVKEFVACTSKASAVMVLSKQTGAWSEFGHNATTISVCTPQEIANAIKSALQEDLRTREQKMSRMKRIASDSDIRRWWHNIVRHTRQLEATGTESLSSV